MRHLHRQTNPRPLHFLRSLHQGSTHCLVLSIFIGPRGAVLRFEKIPGRRLTLGPTVSIAWIPALHLHRRHHRRNNLDRIE